MGAALSVINGIEFMLAYGMNININVHNFGCPRIGNHELAKYIHERVPVI